MIQENPGFVHWRPGSWKCMERTFLNSFCCFQWQEWTLPFKYLHLLSWVFIPEVSYSNNDISGRTLTTTNSPGLWNYLCRFLLVGLSVDRLNGRWQRTWLWHLSEMRREVWWLQNTTCKTCYMEIHLLGNNGGNAFWYWPSWREALSWCTHIHHPLDAYTPLRCLPQTLLAMNLHLITLIFLAGEPKGWLPKSK